MKTAEPLTASAIQLIRNIAVGNDVLANDIKVLDAQRKDYAVTLKMAVGISWRTNAAANKGVSHPAGSTHVSHGTAASGWLEGRLNALAADASVAEAFANVGRSNPAAWLGKLAEGDRIGSAERKCHYHEGCSNCRQSGEVNCGNLLNARFNAKSLNIHQCVTNCCHCQQTGKVRCQCNEGYEYYTEYFYDSYIKGQNSRRSRRICPNCNGTTRSYTNCYMCQGTAVVPCSVCGGSGKVNCGSCGATGWFTHVMVGWLEARPSKTYSYEKAMSPAAISALKSMSSAERVGQCITGSATITHKSGKVHVSIPAKFPEVLLTLNIGAAGRQGFGFVGTGNLIRQMPTFLDELLDGRINNILGLASSKDWLGAMDAAKGAHATSAALRAIFDGSADAKALASRYKGAISSHLVSSTIDALKISYGRLGSQSTRRFWQLSLLPLVIWSVAVPLFSVGRTVALTGLRLGLYQGSALGLADGAAVAALTGLPLIAARLIAGRLSRRKLAKLTGHVAKRPPAMGRWGTVVFLLSAVSLCVGLATSHWSSRLPPGIHLAIGRVAPMLQPQNAHLADTLAPRLTFVAEPAASVVRGDPAIYRLQFGLAQIGLYRGVLDGRAGAGVRDGLAQLSAEVPKDQELKYRNAPVEILAVAMRDDFRLNLPSNESPAGSLSNFARSIISRDDQARIQNTFEAAVRMPGQVQVATSADGKHGVSVISSPVGQNGCITFELELRQGQFVDRTGSRTMCRQGSGWLPSPNYSSGLAGMAQPIDRA